MFPLSIIVNKFLRLSACKTTQVVYLLDGGYADVCYHGFERCFPGVGKAWVLLCKTSGWHLGRFCHASPATICWFTVVNVSISWLPVTSVKGVEVNIGCGGGEFSVREHTLHTLHTFTHFILFFLQINLDYVDAQIANLLFEAGQSSTNIGYNI